MANFKYIERVEYMLEKLLKNEPIRTVEVAEVFGIDDRIIRDDLNKRIKPLFPNTIKKVNNAWIPDKDLKENQFFSSEELLIISLLRTVTKDLDPKIYNKTVSLFQSLHEKASDAIYKQPSIENILKTHEEEFHKIKNAIENQFEITFKYYKNDKYLHPLKIVNLEKYWYLIAFDLDENDLRTFYFKDIKDIYVKKSKFNQSKYNFFDKLDYAINAFYKVDNPIHIELELTGKAFSVLNRKKLNPTQYIVWDKERKIAKMNITVSDLMEIAPLIQQWIPNIYVVSPPELNQLISDNLKKYQIL